MDYSVNVLQFAEARASEIASLMHEVNSSDNKRKTWFQRLPHYMRRRGASQNPKRVPRTLREKNKESQQSKGLVKKNKKPHHRKRPNKNTSSTPTNHTWLETHIWHAKRFKMEINWDYHLPIHSTDKKLGTSHRAAANRCMIQDLSYYCCIEMIGFRDELISQLSGLSDPTSGHTFASKMFLDGAKEGHCFLYHPNSYPFKAIGPVTFLWEPLSDFSSCVNSLLHDKISNERRKLWIWCHPSFHDELVQVLISILDLSEPVCTSENTRFTFPCKLNHKKTEQHFQKEKRYSNPNTHTDMNLLKNTLSRHRLIGPMSLQILSRALRVADVCKFASCIEASCCENGNSAKKLKRSDSPWWKSCYTYNESNKYVHAKQQDLWDCLKDVQSSYYVTPRSVVGLTVRDPRSSPSWARESSTVSDGKGNCKPFLDFDELFTPQVAASPLWNQEIRHEVTAMKLPEHLINEERSKCIVAPDIGEKENRIPVILIHHPPLNGFGSSWDLIAPLGWSLEFWRSYERNGALPAGLRDLRFVNLEAGLPNFPCSFPDTATSKKAQETLQSQSLAELKRHPKSQRPNFSALGIPTPFFMDWKVLVKEWVSQLPNPALIPSFEKSSLNICNALNDFKESNNPVITEDDGKEFFVLRKLDGLFQLCDQANKVSRLSQSKLEELKALIDSFAENSFKSQTFIKSLILVKIKCSNKGSPLTHAGLYLLSDDDLMELKNCPKFCGPTEPNHSEKKNGLKGESNETPKPLFESSSRKMIGCLSEGGFSSVCGRGIGIGHCTSIGFLMMLKQCVVFQLRPVILYRNQHSFQFRVANIELIDNYL